MRTSFPTLTGLVLCVAAGCASDAPPGVVAPGTLAAPAVAAPASEAPAAPAATVDVRGLARRALEAATHAGPLVAIEETLAELRAVQAGGLRPWTSGDDGSLARAEAEVAAALLAELVRDARAQSLVLAERDARGPFAGRLPAEVAFRLERLSCEALRFAGRVDEARALAEAQGYVTDWIAVGPFDNERGAGFDVVQPPELGVERDRPMRGKERDVLWRGLPASHPLGLLEPGLLFEPDVQVTAFFATALAVDAAVGARLAVASDCAIKVSLDGTPVLARKVERERRPDQDARLLALAPGVHVLLVELGVEEGPFTATLRLTAPDGAPLAGVRVDSDLLDQPAPPPAATVREEPARTPDLLAARADAGDDDAALLLALWHLAVSPDDRASRAARVAAESAVRLRPDDAQAHYVLAQALVQQGGSREEIAVDDRLAALERTLALDPTHVSAILSLADFVLDESPRPERADALTARALALAPERLRALRTRARHLDERDRDAEAAELRARSWTTPEGALVPALAVERANDLLRRGAADASEELLRAALGRHAVDGPVHDALLARLVDSGRLDEAHRILQGALLASPLALAARVDAARLFEFAGAPDDARALYDEALEICPEWTVPMRGLLRLDERAGDGEAARARLDEILRLDPGDDLARRHRALLRPETRDDFEAPYRWDAQALLSVPRPAGDGNDPVELLRRTTVHRLHPDGSEHTYEHVAFRALTSAGVKMLDGYAIPVPQGASLQVFAVRVLRPDGSSERAPARGGRGQRRFDLPPLAPGDVVDVEYRVDEEADVFGEYFGTRHMFHPETVDAAAPTGLSELVVLAPRDVPLYVAERNAERLERSVRELADGVTEYRWVARDLPRPEPQSSMPDLVELGPVVDVTTFEDWDAFARWWWSFIEKEFVTTPAMKAKVAELTAGLATERQKVEAINRFVAQEIRYNSWPFGTHGYEPFSAATIFERRFGDCKDKSILLRQLLAEIGVEAIPVLIDARYRQPDEPLAAAMVGQFNHCIAYLPATAEREGYYLDGTADRNPVGYLRADDQGARVLHVSEEGGELHDIPYAPPEENAFVRSYRVALRDDGGGEVELSDRSTGMRAVMLRYRYGGETGGRNKALADELQAGFGPVAIGRVETSDLEDITVPATLDATFTARSLWTPEGRARTLPVGFDALDLSGLAAEPPVDRLYDVVLDRPFAHRTEVRWELPPGASVPSLPPEVRVEEPGLLDYRQTVELDDDGLVVTRVFRLETRRVPKDRYEAFRDALHRVEQAERRTVRIQPGPNAEDSL